MDKDQLDTLKKKLIAIRRELLDGVSKVRESSNEEFEDDVPDLNDEASRTYSRQVMLSIGEVDRHQLKFVDEALNLIENNNPEYGTCIDCEEEIPFKRLEAAPYVRRCRDCKEKWEERLRSEQ